MRRAGRKEHVMDDCSSWDVVIEGSCGVVMRVAGAPKWMASGNQVIGVIVESPCLKV